MQQSLLLAISRKMIKNYFWGRNHILSHLHNHILSEIISYLIAQSYYLVHTHHNHRNHILSHCTIISYLIAPYLISFAHHLISFALKTEWNTDQCNLFGGSSCVLICMCADTHILIAFDSYRYASVALMPANVIWISVAANVLILYVCMHAHTY